MKVNIPYIDPMGYKTLDTTIQANYNKPVEHTLGNSPQLWKESRLMACW